MYELKLYICNYVMFKKSKQLPLFFVVIFHYTGKIDNNFLV